MGSSDNEDDCISRDTRRGYSEQVWLVSKQKRLVSNQEISENVQEEQEIEEVRLQRFSRRGCAASR